MFAGICVPWYALGSACANFCVNRTRVGTPIPGVDCGRTIAAAHGSYDERPHPRRAGQTGRTGHDLQTWFDLQPLLPGEPAHDPARGRRQPGGRGGHRHKIAAALNEHQPTPLGYERTSPDKFVAGFLDAVTTVQKLALRTQDRYRAALERFKEFCAAAGVNHIDAVTPQTVEDFVRWLRGRSGPER